jgi:hypothetical protein
MAEVIFAREFQFSRQFHLIDAISSQSSQISVLNKFQSPLAKNVPVAKNKERK